MGKSKKTRGGQGNRGAIGLVSDVIGVGAVTDAAIDTTAAAIRVGESGAKVASSTLDTVTETNKLAQQVAKSSSLITEKSGLATAQSLESLTTQIGNASDNVTELSNLSKESLNKLTPGISDSVGNVGLLSSTLTKTVNETVTSGSQLVSALISILSLPFNSIKSKIDKMNTEPSDATKKSKNFQEIQNDIIADFTKISMKTEAGFKLQIDKILQSINDFIELLRKTCANGWFSKNCDTETNTIIARLIGKQELLKLKNTRFLTDINGIFSLFNEKIIAIKFEDDPDYLNKLYKSASEIQSTLLTEAMTQLSTKITDLNNAIDSIEGEVNTFLEKPKSIGGRKITNKRRNIKRKIRKSYRKKSKK